MWIGYSKKNILCRLRVRYMGIYVYLGVATLFFLLKFCFYSICCFFLIQRASNARTLWLHYNAIWPAVSLRMTSSWMRSNRGPNNRRVRNLLLSSLLLNYCNTICSSSIAIKTSTHYFIILLEVLRILQQSCPTFVWSMFWICSLWNSTMYDAIPFNFIEENRSDKKIVL